VTARRHSPRGPEGGNVFGRLARLAHSALQDQAEACRRVFTNHTLDRHAGQRPRGRPERRHTGMEPPCRRLRPREHPHPPRRLRAFMVEALTDDALIREEPAIVSRRSPSGPAYAPGPARVHPQELTTRQLLWRSHLRVRRRTGMALERSRLAPSSHPLRDELSRPVRPLDPCGLRQPVLSGRWRTMMCVVAQLALYSASVQYA